MRRRDVRVPVYLGLLTVVVSLAVAGPSSELLSAVPVLVVLVPLSLGRYLGEDVVTRLAKRRALARRARPARAAGAPHARIAPLVPPRGGRLMATSLAGRPPPILVVFR